MITGIDHIDLAVSDVDECVEVFQKIGFQLVSRNDHHGGTAEVKLPGRNQPVFDLHPVTAEHRSTPGIAHIAFKVDNSQEAWDEFSGKGIVFGKARGPHLSQSTGRTLFNLCDPDEKASTALKGWGLYLQFVGPAGKP